MTNLQYILGMKMIYPKNVPDFERALRILFGVGLVVFVIVSPIAISPLVSILALATATFTIVTGFIGWSPACAMMGRKLKSRREKQS